MILIEQAAVAAAALPLAALRDQLRLGTGFDADTLQEALLESALRAALARVEGRTGKVLLARRFAWRIEGWRDAAGQVLPVAPVKALISVAMVDRLGAPVALDMAAVRLEPDAMRPMLLPAGGLLPQVPSGGAVEIVFDAGFAEEWDGLPPDLAQAVLMLAARYYEDREGAAEEPAAVTALLAPWRNVRLSGGGA